MYHTCNLKTEKISYFLVSIKQAQNLTTYYTTNETSAHSPNRKAERTFSYQDVIKLSIINKAGKNMSYLLKILNLSHNVQVKKKKGKHLGNNCILKK